MELKLIRKSKKYSFSTSLNRTFMELKLAHPLHGNIERVCLNRTFMELKHRSPEGLAWLVSS